MHAGASRMEFMLRLFHRFFAPALISLALAAPVGAESFKEAFPEIYEGLDPADQPAVGALELRHGKQTLGDGEAVLDIPADYYFLNAKDARYVLENIWGNPPDEAMLGMVFPRISSPYHSSGWGITFEYDPAGHISDEDADSYDYDELATSMKADLAEENKERAKQGFEPIEFLGWADKPRYDKADHKLYWAKRLKFGTNTYETLNYNIRALGRRGVLVVNFIAGMDQIEGVRASLPGVLKMISFNDGNRYSDFVPGVDTVAAVGIGGLIAGKVAAKTGLLLVLLAFLKKGIVLILLPLAALWNKIKTRLRGGSGPGA